MNASARRAGSFLGQALAMGAVLATTATCSSSSGTTTATPDASSDVRAPDGGPLAAGDASPDTSSDAPATTDATTDTSTDAATDARGEAGPCPAGQTSCGGACVATKVDPANCGLCGNACASGQVCSIGQCSLSCGGGTTQCGSSCIEVDVDPNNCGGCGHACPTGQVCSAAQCATQCGGGLTMCPGASGDGGATPLCVDVQNDPDHCGGCSGVCSTGSVCNGGQCGLSCPGKEVNCNGLCIDPSKDDQFCGASGACGAGDAGSPGMQCPTGQVCNGGVCTVSCPGGEINCNGTCVDPTSDTKHCGATAGCGVADAGSAGSACAVGGSCNGVCGCPAGAGPCGATPGTCTNISIDPQNCGACGFVCGPYPRATGACGGGTCAPVCLPGFLDCDGNTTNGCETNGQNDPKNCGTCGHTCPILCNGGLCAGSADACTEAQQAGTIPLTGVAVDVVLDTRQGAASSVAPCATASGGSTAAVIFSVASAADISINGMQLGNHALVVYVAPPPPGTCSALTGLLACLPAVGANAATMAMLTNVAPGQYILLAQGDQPDGATKYSGAVDLSIKATPH
jgi:Stigma-specific protein, Stig1